MNQSYIKINFYPLTEDQPLLCGFQTTCVRALMHNKCRRLRFKAKREQRNQEIISRRRTACPIPPVPPPESNKHQKLLISSVEFQTASDLNAVDEKPHFGFPSRRPLLSDRLRDPAPLRQTGQMQSLLPKARANNAASRR